MGSWAKACKDVMNNKDMEPNTRMEEVASILLSHGKVWKVHELAGRFLPHPANRGGRMVAWHDMHAKGSIMIKTGIKRDLIRGEVAFEMPADPSHLQKVKDLVASSEGTSFLFRK